MPQQNSILLIGLGNEQRGDDAAGLLIAARLKQRESDRFRVLGPFGDVFEMIDVWKGAGTVILVDAARAGEAPGTIHRMDASTQPIGADNLAFSTHAFGLTQAIELARALGQLPPQVIVYGLEGENFDAGDALTPAVERATREVELLVLKDIAAARGADGPQSRDKRSSSPPSSVLS